MFRNSPLLPISSDATVQGIKFQKTKKCDEWNGMHHSINSPVHCIPKPWQGKSQACLVIGRNHSVRKGTQCAHALPPGSGSDGTEVSHVI